MNLAVGAHAITLQVTGNAGANAFHSVIITVFRKDDGGDKPENQVKEVVDGNEKWT